MWPPFSLAFFRSLNHVWKHSGPSLPLTPIALWTTVDGTVEPPRLYFFLGNQYMDLIVARGFHSKSLTNTFLSCYLRLVRLIISTFYDQILHLISGFPRRTPPLEVKFFFFWRFLSSHIRSGDSQSARFLQWKLSRIINTPISLVPGNRFLDCFPGSPALFAVSSLAKYPPRNVFNNPSTIDVPQYIRDLPKVSCPHLALRMWHWNPIHLEKIMILTRREHSDGLLDYATDSRSFYSLRMISHQSNLRTSHWRT